jgi:hypothetical protein
VVIVRCRKAPLLIARPTTHAARDVEATMYDGTRSELRKHRRANANDEVFVVEIRDGDVVDVLGIDVGTEFVAGSSGGYRESAGRAIPVIGDEDDVRLVLRRVG